MIPGPNWARRYGTQHRRLCARPGCGTPAAATLRFQPTQREAWLVDLDDNAARTEGDLCARHAASLVLPRGWQLHDERAHPVDPTPLPPKRHARHASIARARRRRTIESSPRPELAAVPAPRPVVEPAPRVDTPPAPPAPAPAPAAVPTVEPIDTTVPDQMREELAEVLDAQTPLLRRAFQNVLPRDDTSPT